MAMISFHLIKVCHSFYVLRQDFMIRFRAELCISKVHKIIVLKKTKKS